MHGKTQIKKWFKKFMLPEVRQYGFKIGYFNRAGFYIYREDENGFDHFYVDVSSQDEFIIGDGDKRINLLSERLFEITGFYMFNAYPICTIWNVTSKKRMAWTKIESEQHLIEISTPFKENFYLYVQELDELNNPIKILELCDTLESLEDWNRHFNQQLHKYHLIYFLGQLFEYNFISDWKNKFIERLDIKIRDGHAAYIKGKEDFVKGEKYFERTSPNILNKIKDELIELPRQRTFKGLTK